MKRSTPMPSRCQTLSSPQSTSSATHSTATGTTRLNLGAEQIDLLIYGRLLRRLPPGLQRKPAPFQFGDLIVDSVVVGGPGKSRTHAIRSNCSQLPTKEPGVGGTRCLC